MKTNQTISIYCPFTNNNPQYSKALSIINCQHNTFTFTQSKADKFTKRPKLTKQDFTQLLFTTFQQNTHIIICLDTIQYISKAEKQMFTNHILKGYSILIITPTKQYKLTEPNSIKELNKDQYDLINKTNTKSDFKLKLQEIQDTFKLTNQHIKDSMQQFLNWHQATNQSTDLHDHYILYLTKYLQDRIDAKHQIISEQENKVTHEPDMHNYETKELINTQEETKQPEPKPEESIIETYGYSAYTILDKSKSELLAYAKQLKLKRYSKLNKLDLATLILSTIYPEQTITEESTSDQILINTIETI